MLKLLRNKLKQFFCIHYWKPKISNSHLYFWKCDKCGKIKFKL